MSKHFYTDEEKKEFVHGYDQARDGTIDEYSKKKKIASSQYYIWRKQFGTNSLPKAKLRAWRAPKDDKATIRKLEAKNEVLKEMLEDALTNKAA